MKLILIIALFFSWNLFAGDTAFWVVHCNGDPLKAEYKHRPTSKFGENLTKAADTCFYVMKDFYTKKFHDFQPVVHKDKLQLHMRLKKFEKGEYDLELTAKFTPVKYEKNCHKKPKVEEVKEVKKSFKQSISDENKFMIVDFNSLNVFGKWNLIDLEIKLVVKLNDQIIHTANEKFLNWPKCDLYKGIKI